MNIFRLFGVSRPVFMNEAGGGDAGGGGSLLGSAPASAATPTPTPAAEPSPATDVLAEFNKKETVGDAEAKAKAEADAALKPNETAEEKTAREAAEKARADAVPEAYADYTVPEGLTLDPAMLADANAVFKELGLSQEKAQKLIDLQTKYALGQDGARAEALKTALDKQAQDWTAEIKNDPEFGGAKFDSTVSSAVKAMQAFGDAPLRQLLNESGIGNNPSMVKLFAKIGSAIGEDKIVIPGSDATEQTERSAADVMFGDVFKKS